MQLIVSVFGVRSLVVHIEGRDNVEYLRDIISLDCKIPSKNIRLLSCSKQLTDDRILSDYLEIGDNSTVNVLLSCVGGMKRCQGLRVKNCKNSEIESKSTADLEDNNDNNNDDVR